MSDIDPGKLREIVENVAAATPSFPAEWQGKLRAWRRRLEALLPRLTMSEIEWEDGVHDGLCAEHKVHGLVRMIAQEGGDIHIIGAGPLTWCDPASLTPIPGTRIDLTPRREPHCEVTANENHNEDAEIINENRNDDIDGSSDKSPTISDDLPRPEDVPPGETWEVDYDDARWIGLRSPGGGVQWVLTREVVAEHYAKDNEVTLIRRLVPEQAPAHPKVLTTEEDYENAPEGTIVAADGGNAFIKPGGGHGWYNTLAERWECNIMANATRTVRRWGWES